MMHLLSSFDPISCCLSISVWLVGSPSPQVPPSYLSPLSFEREEGGIVGRGGGYVMGNGYNTVVTADSRYLYQKNLHYVIDNTAAAARLVGHIIPGPQCLCH